MGDDERSASGRAHASADEHAAIGRRLADLRRRSGLSQVEAARSAGMSQTKLARLETGARRLLFSDAVRLATGYGVSLTELAQRTVRDDD